MIEYELCERDLISWLRSERCPECHYTFKACACGTTMRILVAFAAKYLELRARPIPEVKP